MGKKNTIGIYEITNKKNGKKYIGQSIHIEHRWEEHKSVAKNKNNETYNYPLYKAFRKYGVDNFEFKIIEIIKNENELLDREIFWYEKIKPQYNQVHPTQIYDNKLSKQIYKIDKKTLEILNEYDSISQASREIGFSVSAIYYACNGKNITANGFYWCYKDDYSSWSVRNSKKKTGRKGKRVYQIDKDTLQIINEFENMEIASKMTKINAKSIRSVVSGRTLSGGGFYWCLKDNYSSWSVKKPKKQGRNGREVYQIDKDTLKILNEYESITRASIETKINLTSIAYACNEKNISGGGFYWCYKEKYTKNWKPRVKKEKR